MIPLTLQTVGPDFLEKHREIRTFAKFAGLDVHYSIDMFFVWPKHPCLLEFPIFSTTLGLFWNHQSGQKHIDLQHLFWASTRCLGKKMLTVTCSSVEAPSDCSWIEIFVAKKNINLDYLLSFMEVEHHRPIAISN